MAQIEAVFVFCSSCKILYFANSVHPKNATEKQGHRRSQEHQEPLMQTLIVRLLKTHFLHSSLIVKSQLNRIELLTRPATPQSSWWWWDVSSSASHSSGAAGLSRYAH